MLLGGAKQAAEQGGHASSVVQQAVLMWPQGDCVLTSHQSLMVGLLFLLAAAGKSALVPFSGWLPRAMEGPTPSSAVFYGALSVHLGAFLMLRISPILEQSLTLRMIVISLGLITAVFAAIAGRVQTDINPPFPSPPHAGRHHLRGNWLGYWYVGFRCRTGSHSGPCLPANAAIRRAPPLHTTRS
jgi:NADH:ubiquinone oxidoreductase subunit 4 (subunit M)